MRKTKPSLIYRRTKNCAPCNCCSATASWRRGLALVAVEMHLAQRWHLQGQRFEPCSRPIYGAVIDRDDLEGGIVHERQRAKGFGELLLFVVAWHQHRHARVVPECRRVLGPRLMAPTQPDVQHAHPYGEFNMVVPLNEGAALAGPNGWCHGGWSAPAPGSHHYPAVKGGAVIALFYLPAGRISYAVQAPD